MAHQLDEHHQRFMAALTAQADAAAERAEHHREHLDLLSNSQREQVDVTTTELQLEVGRLRGELMVLRELVGDLTEQLEATQTEVEDALKRTGRTIDATMAALRAAAQEPARPVREALAGVTGRVSAAWRGGRGRAATAPRRPTEGA